MTEPLDPERAADGAISAVEFRLGPLGAEERAKIHGCVYGRALTDPFTPVSLTRIKEMTSVLRQLRTAPCPHCSRDIAGHTFELTQYDLQIWCDRLASSLPVAEWLTHGGKPDTARAVWSGLMWIGIPLLSMGFLAWLPSLIATAVRRRREWTLAALVFGAVFLVALVLAGQGEGTTWSRIGGFLILANAVGGAIFGGLQMKRWLAPTD